MLILELEEVVPGASSLESFLAGVVAIPGTQKEKSEMKNIV